MDGMRFQAFLAICTALVGAFVVYAFTWADQPGDPRVELNPSVTRLAFGLDAWPGDREPRHYPDLVFEPVERRPMSLHIVEMSFVGDGDWDIGSTIVRRNIQALERCFSAEGQQTLEIRLRDWAEPLVSASPEEEASCVGDRIRKWPWPQDLQGRVRLELRAGHLI